MRTRRCTQVGAPPLAEMCRAQIPQLDVAIRPDEEIGSGAPIIHVRQFPGSGAAFHPLYCATMSSTMGVGVVV